jgi:hypothetical protein
MRSTALPASHLRRDQCDSSACIEQERERVSAREVDHSQIPEVSMQWDGNIGRDNSFLLRLSGCPQDATAAPAGRYQESEFSLPRIPGESLQDSRILR